MLAEGAGGQALVSRAEALTSVMDGLDQRLAETQSLAALLLPAPHPHREGARSLQSVLCPLALPPEGDTERRPRFTESFYSRQAWNGIAHA